MKIGLLIIGSEVLDGKISDLNTKILAEFLRASHLEISDSVIVRDKPSDIQDGLKSLWERNDLIVTTGGLGPTKDDITKETIAHFFNRKITYNEESHKVAETNYKRFERPFPGKEHGYCYLPEGFKALSNSTGFAPGFYFLHDHKILFSAPGVPREFKGLLEDHLIGLLPTRSNSNDVLGHFIVRTKNVPEEKIFGEVDTTLWHKLEEFGEVSSLPILMGVDIGIKLKASSQEDMEFKVQALANIFNNSPLKKHIWSIGPRTLEEKIIEIANKKKIRFGFAESATGGLCSHRITSVSGASMSLMGSVVCYDESIKEHILGVDPKTLKNHTAVSAECAMEMAIGLKEKFNLDIAVSITGYAGPSGGDEKNPVGTVYIGVAGKDNSQVVNPYLLKGDREILKQRFSQAALYALLEELENFASL